MAIINGELSGSRKKLGSVVYQKGRDGKTIARRYVIPKNPRTSQQMAQRILFATITQAAKFMGAVVDHSFEGVSKGAKSINRFTKLNVPVLRAKAANDFGKKPAADASTVFVTTKGVTALIPNNYLISDGSLAKPAAFVSKSDQGLLNLNLGGLTAMPMVSTEVESDTYFGLTYAQIARAIFGVTETNEQLSLCAIARTAEEYQFSYEDSAAIGYQIPYTAFNARRLVFSPSADLSQVCILMDEEEQLLENASENLAAAVQSLFNAADTDTQLLDAVVSAITAMQLTTGGTEETGYTVSGAGAKIELDSLYIYDVAEQAGHCYAAGIIRSKNENGSWRRSRAYMVTATPTAENNFGLVWSIANPAWFRTEVIAESSLFLNEGGTKNEVGENF